MVTNLLLLNSKQQTCGAGKAHVAHGSEAGAAAGAQDSDTDKSNFSKERQEASNATAVVFILQVNRDDATSTGD